MTLLRRCTHGALLGVLSSAAVAATSEIPNPDVILNEAGQLRAAGRHRDAASLYLHGVRHWQGEDMQALLRQACDGLFDTLLLSKTHEDGAHLLEPCPEDQVDYLYGRVDRDYALRLKVAPRIPIEEIARPRVGFVRMRFNLDEAGRTYDIRVLERTSKAFARAAASAKRRDVYLPRIENGRAVPVHDIEAIARFRWGSETEDRD